MKIKRLGNTAYIEAGAILDRTPSGLVLPPGVGAKLHAKNALERAEALVQGAAVRQADGGLDGGEAERLLQSVNGLRQQISAKDTLIADLEARLAGLESSERHGPEPLAIPHPEAVALLARGPLFLDYETTGLSKYRDQVVEVAVVNGQGRIIFESLVHPGRPIPAGASAINGIYDADVAGAPEWGAIAPALRAILGNQVVVAHNAKFEAKFTPAEWGIEWACSKRLADEVLGPPAQWGAGSLAARLAQCGLEPGPAHRAVGDCISVLRLIKYFGGV